MARRLEKLKSERKAMPTRILVIKDFEDVKRDIVTQFSALRMDDKFHVLVDDRGFDNCEA